MELGTAVHPANPSLRFCSWCVSRCKNGGLPNCGDDFRGRNRLLFLGRRGVRRCGCDRVALVAGGAVYIRDLSVLVVYNRALAPPPRIGLVQKLGTLSETAIVLSLGEHHA